MTLEITLDKKYKIHNLFLEILQKEKITLRTLATVIGNFVASFPAVPLGPFFYRKFGTSKNNRANNCQFKSNIALNVESKKEIYW